MKKTFYSAFVFLGIIIKSQIGVIDTSFNVGTGSDNFVYQVSIQSDQKIIASGNFTSFNGYQRKYIVRLNLDGSVDTSFNPAVTNNLKIIKNVIQNDGKIIVIGQNQDLTYYYARLNTDGSIDNTFKVQDYGGVIGDVTILPDGRLLLKGDKLYCINTNGTIDANFNAGNIGTNNYINGIYSLADNKILIVGGFTKYNNVDRKGIARLNPDGTLDETFNPGTGVNNTIYGCEQQDDGKILLAGFFTSYNEIPRNFLVRINQDGSLDTTFNSQSSGSNDALSYVTKGKNGKILISGAFTKYNDITKYYLTILNPNGTLENNDTDINFDNPVNNCVKQSDGKLVCGGYFSSFSGKSSKGVVRIIPNDLLSVEDFSLVKIKIAPNPVTDKVSIFIPKDGTAIFYDINGKKVGSYTLKQNQNEINISKFSKGLYFVEITSDNNTQNFKLIKN
ncbi:T9SS type A sorting domain-containing protein [Epilithonimonas hominis]|uniref:T9SS type A sorting domain-containing protein n=1 Tax=Epilithonimonas hominis TaxID=420404 RepID=UPI00289C10CB|nr:T9SS type A sorting domain-containing protein [Epilithonimonas hominis]